MTLTLKPTGVRLSGMANTTLTVKEAAALLKVGDQRVRDLIKAGRLRAEWHAETRTWRVLLEDVQNFRRLKPWQGKLST